MQLAQPRGAQLTRNRVIRALAHDRVDTRALGERGLEEQRVPEMRRQEVADHDAARETRHAGAPARCARHQSRRPTLHINRKIA